MYLKSESFFAYGGKNKEHNLSINNLRDEGEPSIKFTPPVKKMIEGIESLKSVKEIALSFNLSEILEEIFAEILKFSSPETSAKHPARRFEFFHEIIF